MSGRKEDVPSWTDPDDTTLTPLLSVKTLAAYRDPLGREPGEPLDPARHNAEQVRKLIAKVGPRMWFSMWQQTPRAEGGNFLSRQDFLRKRGEDGRSRMVKVRDVPTDIRWCRFWDLAFSTKSTNKGDPDWTVGAKLGFKFDDWDGFEIYLVDLVRFRGNWTDVKRKIREVALEDGTDCHIGAESNGPQKAAVDDLIHDRKLAAHTIVGLPVILDKVARANPWGDRAREGMMWVLEGIPGKLQFFDEIEAFPNGTKDDIVDSISGAYIMAAQRALYYEAVRSEADLLRRW